MKRNNLLLLTTILTASLAVLTACSKDDDSSSSGTTDQELFDLAKSASGFTWFENSDALLPKSSGTGHAQPLLRTRYNATAAAQLDADGRVKPGATFPEGSLIVKELHDNATTIAIFAVMYKQPSNPNADDNGWVWAYLAPDGSVPISSSGKGSGCNGCHGQAEHIDYTLMNKFF
jgi:hypothetical protein